MKKKLLTLLLEGDGKMMKKLLVVMLVLGISSIANAGLQISVNGDLNPVDTEITLLPSETATLDIWTDSMIFGFGEGEGDWLLYADTTVGTISGGIVNPALEGQGNVLAIYEGKAFMSWSPDPPDPFDGVGGAVFIFGAPIAADTVIYDGIIFQCEAPGDVLVSLAHGSQVGGNMVLDQIWDTVTIHQVPEPATIALLGLGGLFLRRRRKKSK